MTEGAAWDVGEAGDGGTGWDGARVRCGVAEGAVGSNVDSLATGDFDGWRGEVSFLVQALGRSSGNGGR